MIILINVILLKKLSLYFCNEAIKSLLDFEITADRYILHQLAL